VAVRGSTETDHQGFEVRFTHRPEGDSVDGRHFSTNTGCAFYGASITASMVCFVTRFLVEGPTVLQCLYDALRGAAIPAGDGCTLLVAARKAIVNQRRSQVGIAPDYGVCAICDGDRTFRVVAQCEAWNAEKRGFFLNPAGIRENHCGPLEHAEILDVCQRIEYPDPLVRV
jgi:hypothetical protein